LKRLIVNADDFGFTHDVNAGIIQAHREGILTATTLMANGDAFEDAVRLAQQTPSLDIGCHLVLVQGRSLSTGKPLPVDLKNVVLSLAARRIDAYREFRAQIEKIVAAGLNPSHLDSHKHTHLVPSVFMAAVRLAREFNIPYIRIPVPTRRFYASTARRYGVTMTDHLLGFRLTGSLTEQTLASTIQRLPKGTTELFCHPGYLGDELAAATTRLKASRVHELEALTSPRIRALLQQNGIHLTDFRSQARLTPEWQKSPEPR
jgi:predicted glycoside hydrolase/deacetylase ChbG (UPF0249 family)